MIPPADSFASSSTATGRWYRVRTRTWSSRAINMSGPGCCCAGRSASTTLAHSQLALDLIDRAEARGVDATRGVAINALFGDGSIRDARARLWPQTERIKAACLAGAITGEARYSAIAAAATRSLMKYLDTPTPGLWRDTMDEHGAFVEQFAPASSFYHIVSAVPVLSSARNRHAAQPPQRLRSGHAHPARGGAGQRRRAAAFLEPALRGSRSRKDRLSVLR